MSTGLFNRVKTWIAKEVVYADDLNTEFNNIVSNLNPLKFGAFSDNLSQYQLLSQPGTIGSEILPTSLAEEIQQIRAQIKALTGEAQWYSPPSISLSTVNSLGVVSAENNRIISGKIDTNEQPQVLLTPASGRTVTCQAVATPLVLTINGVQQTITADTTITTAFGPSALHTAAVAFPSIFSSSLTGISSDYGKTIGIEEGSKIYLSAPGALIQTRAGLGLSAFSATGLGVTECFIGLVKYDLASSLYYIDCCQRGFFFKNDGTATTLNFVDTQLVVLLNMSWLFVDSAGTLKEANTSLRDPYCQATEPTAGAADGEFWYDTILKTWKTRISGVWTNSLSTLLGWSCQNSTTCIGTKTLDFYSLRSQQNSTFLVHDTNSPGTRVVSVSPGGKIDVDGAILNLQKNQLVFDTASSLGTGVSLTSGTKYYLYISRTLNPIISNVAPQKRESDLVGYYHPSAPWRCLGAVKTEAATTHIDSSSTGFGILQFAGAENIPSNSVGSDKLKKYQSGFPEKDNYFLEYLSPGKICSIGTVTLFTSPPIKISGRPISCSFRQQNKGTSGPIIFNSSSGDAYGSIIFDLILDNGIVVPLSFSQFNDSFLAGAGAKTYPLSCIDFIAIPPIKGPCFASVRASLSVGANGTLAVADLKTILMEL